jgi:hypothetical protein
MRPLLAENAYTYLDPIRQEVMDAIKEKLPSIRSRKP